MAIIKVRNKALTLLDTANGKIAGSNLDVSFENITDTGTEGTRVATGTTGQRGTTAGQLRFNTTTGLAEYYTGNVFKSIDIAPLVSSVNNTNINGDSITAGFDLVLSGTNFATGATVKFIGNDGTEYVSPTVTIDSATQITTRIPTNIDATKEPFDVQVTSAGGLSSIKENAFNIDATPSWTTASGSIGGGFNGDTLNLQVTATDADGSVSYAIQSGALPSGVSLNTSTGAITGTLPSVGAVTTYTFTIRATSDTGQTTDRQFSIINGGAGVEDIYRSSSSFTISQAQPVKLYVIGGGGGGGSTSNGSSGGAGGGGGGMTSKMFANLSAGTYSFTVGGKGSAGNSSNQNGGTGGTSSITLDGITLQATGGSGGTAWVSESQAGTGGAGGIGSGGDVNGTGGAGGDGIAKSNDSTGIFNGNNGSNGINGGAGGGGSGSDGSNSNSAVSGNGGNGSSTYYTGGGASGGLDADGADISGKIGSAGTGYTSGGIGGGIGVTATNGGGIEGGLAGTSGSSRNSYGGGGGSYGGGGGGTGSADGGTPDAGQGGGGAIIVIS